MLRSRATDRSCLAARSDHAAVLGRGGNAESLRLVVFGEVEGILTVVDTWASFKEELVVREEAVTR